MIADAPRLPRTGRLIRLALALGIAFTPMLAIAQTTRPTPAADAPTTRPVRPHVLVVSIDGARPDVMLRADMPTVRRLMRAGSFTMWATTTDVAVTTPSHVSMMTGVTPEKHGITFNADPPPDARIAVPTLFDLAKRHGYTTALASGKRKFTLFDRTDSIDWQWITDAPVTLDDREVADRAAEIIVAHRPDVMLVHFPGADVAGHADGWGTPAQVEKLGQIDEGIDRVLKAYATAGLLGDTYVFVSADHGGTVRTHGAGDIRSHFIPWICVGPDVRADYDLTRLGRGYDVRTYDTFATACDVLHIPAPPGIDGKAIEPMFRDYDLLLVADKPSKQKDLATAYMDAERAPSNRPVWRGAGEPPTTAPADATSRPVD